MDGGNSVAIDRDGGAGSNGPIDAALLARAREVLAGRGRLASGCLHLLGLDEVRVRVGARWPQLRERVHDIAARTIARHLTPQDIAIPYGEERFFIVFPSLEKRAALLVVGRIKAELLSLLIGETDIGAVTVETMVAELDGRLLLETHRVADLMAAAAALDAPALEAPPEAPPAANAAPAPRLVYRPLWDAGAQVFSMYVCEAERGGQRRWATLACPEDPDAILALDLATITAALATASTLFERRFRYVQSIPVHFETLASLARRRAYTERCRAIPAHLVPFLTFDVHETPAGIPASRLVDLTSGLVPVCRALSVRTTPDHLSLQAYVDARIRAVGVEAGSAGVRGRLHELERFAAVARRAGLAPWVDGVADAACLEAARGAGFRYVGGPIIGAGEDAPRPMARCSERELLVRARVRAEGRAGASGGSL